MASIAGVHREKVIFSNTSQYEVSVGSGVTALMLDSSNNPIQVSVNCDGGLVEVGLMDDPNQSPVGTTINADGRANTNSLEGIITFYRDGVQVGTQSWGMVDISGSSRQMAPPIASYRIMDNPTAGTHVYTASYTNPNASQANNEYSYVRLYAVKR